MAAPPFRRFDDPKQFHELVAPALAAREVENGLLLGAARRLADTGEPAFLAAMTEGGAPAVVALRTPPHALVVSAAAVEDIVRLAAWLHECHEPVPAVLGLAAVARAFAGTWAARTGLGQRLQNALTFYTLPSLVPPEQAPGGGLRAATQDDAAWLTDWYVAFADEAGLPPEERGLRHNAKLVRKKIAEARQFVWEDEGRPVAIVGHVPTGLSGARLAPVMTAPSDRRKGYASAAIAAVCRGLLDSGTSWCGLFADAAYAPSNRVYRRLGFVEVCRFESIAFEPRGAVEDETRSR